MVCMPASNDARGTEICSIPPSRHTSKEVIVARFDSEVALAACEFESLHLWDHELWCMLTVQEFIVVWTPPFCCIAATGLVSDGHDHRHLWK